MSAEKNVIVETRETVTAAVDLWATLRVLSTFVGDQDKAGIITPKAAAALLVERGMMLKIFEQLTGDYSAGEQTLAALRARALIQAARAQQN